MVERRAEPRMLCSELVEVHWQDHQGLKRKSIANLEDISLSGLCLHMEEPVRLHTPVRIVHAKGEFEGTVRYCLYRDIGYFLGIQFLPGKGWSPESYQPQYLLDLRTLVERSMRRKPKRASAGEARG